MFDYMCIQLIHFIHTKKQYSTSYQGKKITLTDNVNKGCSRFQKAIKKVTMKLE